MANLVVRLLLAHDLTPTTQIHACADGSLWQSVSVVGDAGVNHLGYYTCAWRPDGLAIATHGHSGALHVWNAGRPDEDGCLKELDGVIDDDEDVYYLPAGPCSCGHTGPVVDSSWSPDGTTLCTVSTDQTCRLWGNPDGQCWREVGRPQVHGHDFSCVAFVSNDVYVSGSEEKVARVFDNSLTDERGARVQVRLPALGLSNVVCQDARDGNGNKDEDGLRGGDVGGDVNSVLAKGTHASITEEDLSQNTLWPEIRKLYGHGNDLYRLVADPRGRFIASSSRAQEPVSAAVIVWDTTTWTEVARCAGHDLTVTCMDCNDSGDLLATVGRDRKLIVWERLGGAEDEGSISGWRIRASKPKAHARVIWGCAWANQEKEGKEEMRQLHRSTLITSARDGSISAWDVLDAALVKKAEIKLASSVTTVAAQGSLIAAGLESGHVVILVLREDDDRDDCDDRDDGDPRNRVCGLDVVCTCGEEGRHAGAVRRVHFCPGNKNDRSRGEASLLLSSVGDDGAVKFWRTHHLPFVGSGVDQDRAVDP
jgi:elongator complex protein 2